MEIYKIIEHAKESETLPKENYSIKNKNQIHIKYFPEIQIETSTGSKSDSQQNESNNQDSIQLQLQQIKKEQIQFINIKQFQILTEPNSKKWLSQQCSQYQFTNSMRKITNCAISFAIQDAFNKLLNCHKKQFTSKGQLRKELFHAIELLEYKQIYLGNLNGNALSSRQLCPNCKDKILQVILQCKSSIDWSTALQSLMIESSKIYSLYTCLFKLQSLQDALRKCSCKAFRPKRQEDLIIENLKLGFKQNENSFNSKKSNEKQNCLKVCLKKLFKKIWPEKKKPQIIEEEQEQEEQSQEEEMNLCQKQNIRDYSE